MSSTYLDRPGVSHGSTCAFRYGALCALSLSATVATRARRDTCDLLVSLLSLNSKKTAKTSETGVGAGAGRALLRPNQSTMAN